MSAPIRFSVLGLVGAVVLLLAATAASEDSAAARPEAGVARVTVHNHTHLMTMVSIDEEPLGSVEPFAVRTFTVPAAMANRDRVTLTAVSMACRWSERLTGNYDNYYWNLMPNP